MNLKRLDELINEAAPLTAEQSERAAALRVAQTILSRGDDLRPIDTVDLISTASWIANGVDPYASDDDSTSVLPDAAHWSAKDETP